MSELLQAALDAARAAAAIIADADRKREFKVMQKGHADFVTEVDIAAELAVTSILRARFPDHAILGEEGGASGGDASAEWRWVIDPLDGTTNFIRGIPFFGVSVGLEHRGEPVVGVVIDGSRGTEWRGERGEGAWVGDKRLRVSPEANLAGATFYKADLTGANLSGADLTKGNLPFANLTNVNLGGARVADQGNEAAALRV